jgi:ethanolamine utilization protein EutN
MQLARVIGQATATVKHPTLSGWRLLLVQCLAPGGKADGEPLLAIDHLGAGMGSRVVITSEGGAVRETVKSKQTPIRWMVVGLCDE